MHMGVDLQLEDSAGRMGRCVVVRYGFNIKTKHGQRVENILIMAASIDDAERRLRQMYHHCEIIECREQAVPRRVDTLDMEGVIGLISASPPSLQPSGHKAGTH
jgi:hypothetical protein